MSGTTVPVTAEWALWGKGEQDAGYRLLDYSEGTVSRENFAEALTRYSPGTLDSLPQVTMSWRSDGGRGSSLAIAIHDRSARSDAVGRNVVQTSYFCAPFNQLAAGPVSYTAMYEGFKDIRLPVEGRAMISTALATARPAAPGHGLAMRVAALLLTGTPVCVLGADQVGLRGRLDFLDEVASLLPYGMRSRLSASTWASSTQRGHKLRLFFANARRNANDHVVTWDQDQLGPIGHSYADDYLSWLASAASPVGELARYTEPLDLARQVDILKMLERLGVVPSQAIAQWHSQALPPHVPPPPTQPPSVEDLLISCAQRLHQGKNPDFLPDLDRLRGHLSDQVTARDLQRYQAIIAKYGLLRPDPPVKSSLLAQLYNVLLRLAFATPLDYESYCRVEQCAGGAEQGGPHQALARAMQRVGVAGSARLLVAMASGQKELDLFLHGSSIPLTELIAMAADPTLRAEHARAVIDVVVQDLLDWPDHLDHRELLAALQRHGYLVTALRRSYPDDPTSQMIVLGNLLALAHGHKLSADDVGDIFDRLATPSLAAFAALLQMVDPADVWYVRWRFTYEIIAKSGLHDQTRENLAYLLGHDTYADVDDADELAPQASRGPWWKPGASRRS